MTAGTNKLIRNSTAEFLIFTGPADERSIKARYENKTVCTQTQEGGLNEQKE